MKSLQFTVKGFAIWGICALFFLYEFLIRTVVGTFQHPVMYDLQLSALQFSLLSSTLFLFVYGIMQLPVGIIINKYGLKAALVIGTLSCSLASFGFAYSHAYVVAILFRLFMGVGASFGFISLLMSVKEWMPEKHLALFIGISQFIGTMGPMVAAGPLEELAHQGVVDWRFLFTVLGVVGLVLFLLVYYFVENNKTETTQYTILKRPESFRSYAYRLLKRSQPWYIALLSSHLYFTIEYLSENEGRAFLSHKGIASGIAGYMITFSWLGYALASPFAGFISDRLQRRKIVLIAYATIQLIAILGIIFSSSVLVLYASFFLLGVGASGQTVGFATIAEHFKAQFVSLGFALNNAMICIVASINAPLIGFVLDSIAKFKTIGLKEYQIAFSILIGVALVAWLVSIFALKETYCKSDADFTYLNP